VKGQTGALGSGAHCRSSAANKQDCGKGRQGGSYHYRQDVAPNLLFVAG